MDLEEVIRFRIVAEEFTQVHPTPASVLATASQKRRPSLTADGAPVLNPSDQNTAASLDAAENSRIIPPYSLLVISPFFNYY